MPPTGTNAFLHWEVFVTPGIPIVTRDKPPDVRETYFQAMAATLIYGVRDAVLVDAFMTVTQANALADWVAARNRNLKTIYITHGHGDHWFGLATLLERFPNAKAVATPNAVRVMRQNASPEALEGVWKVSFPGQIPDRLVIADELDGHLIDLEGHELVAVELGHTDTDLTTCLHVPSIGLVVAGDAAYNDVHLYLAESKMCRHGRNGSLLSTRLTRSTHAQWSHPTSDLKTTTILRSLNRLGSTSAISIALRRRRRPRKTSTRRYWSCIPIESTLGGRSGVRHVRSSH